MSAPKYTQFTERMYARLPEVMREADALNDYALKRYISAIGDVEDQVERLIARFSYLTKQERLGLDSISDEFNYYDLDWRYFQSTDSKNSALISSDAPAFLRTLEAYRVVPSTIIYTGSVFRTNSPDATSTYGLRLWYYDAAMKPLTFQDIAKGNGAAGPQWVALNATDQVPAEAYYLRVSPYSKPATGSTVRVWVDDVYVRSHYEVTTTNNLVSSGHNFVMRAEQQMVKQGDFDTQREALYMVDGLRAQAEDAERHVQDEIAAVDGKTLLRQSTAPTGSADTYWVNTADGDKLMYWDNRLGDQPRTNLAERPSYELNYVPSSNNSFWRHTRTTEFSRFGDYSVQSEVVSVGPGTSAWLMSAYNTVPGSLGRPVTPGVEYENTAWLMSERDAVGSLTLRFRDVNGAYLDAYNGAAVAMPGGVWVQAKVRAIAPPNAVDFWYTGASVQAATGLASVGDRAYIDAVSLSVVSGSSASSAYFDGDMPGARWEGTPHDSVSIYDGPRWVELTASPAFTNPRVLLAEDQVVQAWADVAYAESEILLSAWDRGPSTELVDLELSNVPDIQSYRTWLELKSTDAAQPGYARQVVQGVTPSTTYDFSTLILRNASVLDASTMRVTITPDTGGPTVKTFTMADYDRDRPHLVTFPWTSPETVATAIVNIEYIGTVPTSGLFINDVSMVRYVPTVSQIGRIGTPATRSVTERAGESLLESGDLRSEGWDRYATADGPDSPLAPSDPDPAQKVSYAENVWHQTRPGNIYTLSGELFADQATGYVDLMIWYRTDGKGWGEQMLHRITTNTLSSWALFSRSITIPDTATEFRVNLDFYRAGSTRRTEMRNLALTPTSARSWYMAGSRPFALNALATRSLNFLSRGDLLHYTASLMVTGTPSVGRYGIRVYAGDGKLVHETVVRPSVRNSLIQITGAFQVPESLMDLRATFYVDDPTPKHQAAYFLSNLEIVHSSQQFVEEPQNMIRNGGFEFANALEDWVLLAERETVRRNLHLNPKTTGPIGGASGAGTVMSVGMDGDLPFRRVSFTSATPLAPGNTGMNYNSAWPVSEVVRLGDKFSASVLMRASKATELCLYIQFLGPTGNNIGNHQRVIRVEANTWTSFVLEGCAAPSDEVTTVRMLAYGYGVSNAERNWVAGDTMDVAQALIERGDIAGPWFDGDSPDTALTQYDWATPSGISVERTISYSPPVMSQMGVSIDAGYNQEDVPDRPDDAPLGSTSDLVDPRTANTEWLPWLSQFAGHNINHFGSLEEARTAFSDTESNFAAGTIGAIQNAVGAVLTGSKTVRVFPMTTRLDQVGKATQWDIAIVTRTSESPDISVMEEAVHLRNAKPVGVRFHFFKHQSTWDAVELAYPQWNDWDARNWTQIEEAGLSEA